MKTKTRLVIFSPYHLPLVNPRSIRINNLIKEIQNHSDYLYITNPVQNSEEVFKNEKLHGFKLSIQQGNTIQNNHLLQFISRFSWPDPFLLNSVYHFFIYFFKYRKKTDNIYTCSNPISIHSIGLLSKLLFIKKPYWVADIGDLLQYADNSYFKFITPYYEKIIVKHADKIIVNSSAIFSYLAKKFPEQKEKLHIIYNGTSFNSNPLKYVLEKPLPITYIGNSYNPIRNGIEELSILLEIHSKLSSKNIESIIRLIGRQNQELINKFQLPAIQFINYCTGSELQEYYCSARLLFSLANKNYPGMPSKIEEYCRTGIPIIYFCYSKNDPGISYLQNHDNFFIFILGSTDKIDLYNFIESHLLSDQRRWTQENVFNQPGWVKILEDLNNS